MTYIFSNNAATALTVAIDDVVTQLTVLDASLFPASASASTPCKVTLQDVDTGEIEICDCTNINGNVLTVIRGQENTAAISFPIGAVVHHRITAENLSNFVQDLDNVGSGEGRIAHSRVGALANFKTLKQGSNTTISDGPNEVTIDSIDTNTASGANLGSTPGRQGIYASNSGTQLNLKSLVGGTDIEFVATTEEITANYTGTGGAGGPGNIPTGVYTGGVVTINANQTSVDVTAGTGVIVDAYTNPDAPVYTDVSWGNVNVPIYPNLASDNDSIILSIEAGGTFTERRGGVDDSTPNRTVIDIAAVKTSAGVITSVTPFKSIINTNHHTFFDYYQSQGSAFFLNTIKKEYLTPQSGLRLHFNSGFSNGFFFSPNARFDLVGANPHLLPRVINGGSSFEVTYWKYIDYNGNITGPALDLDPANYDIGLGVTPVPGPAGASTIQYIWHAPGEGDFIEYCQKYYDTIDEASKAVAYYIDSLDRDRPNVMRGWILVGAIVFWKGATDCLNTNHARVYTYRNGIFNAPFISKSVSDDPAPILSADLQTNGYAISIQDSTPVEQGRIEYDATINGVYLGFIADASRGFDPLIDGGVLAKAGELTLSGTIIELNAFKGGSENFQLYVSEDGILFGVRPPVPGWEETDTDNANYTFPTLGTWVHIVGLIITVPQDVGVGERIDAFVNLYFQNGSGNQGGSIDIGIGINGVEPTTALNNVRMEAGFDSVIATAITTTTHGGITTGDTISVFVRRSTQDNPQFDPNLLGAIDPSELIVSVPGEGGGGPGGDPTHLGNDPGATTVTITSSTGTDTVIAGAVPGTAGVMTGTQVTSLNSKIDATGVTYENLDANGDVGPGVGQLEPGLDVPAQDGHVLSSTVAGVRTWIPPGGGSNTSVTIPVKVKTGTIVVEGSGVAAVGWDATSGRVLVQGSDAISLTGMPAIGFALATHAADEEFDLPIYGEFDYNTSAWAENDRLYQANLGAVVTSPPNNDGVPNQEIAKVLVSSVTGKLFVNPDNHGVYIDWAAATIPEPADANYGYLRIGGGTPAWVRGAKVFEAATNPGGQSVGDFTFITS